MSFTQELKNYILSAREVDLVGIAPASAMAHEEHFHTPEEILPGAKSIVVFGRRLSDGAVEQQMRKFEDNNVVAQSAYAAYASDLAPNFLLLFDTFNISQYIERHFGYTAVPLPCGPMQNGEPTSTPMPHFAGPHKAGLPFNIDKAAMAAGLGEFGWNNRILTPEYGPRVQFGAIITSMELAYDEPYHGEKLCDPKKCGICSKLCPTGAIPACGSGEEKEISIEGKSVTVSDLKANRCIVAAYALRSEFAGRIPTKDLVDSYDPTEEELVEAFAKKPIASLSLDHYPKYFCDRCLIYCPVGNWKERFEDRGLSKMGKENADEKA